MLRKRKSARLILTKRDINFFHFLFKYKIAPIKEIKRYCYPTCSEHNLRRRLRKIERYGFIKKDSIPSEKRIQIAYYLTPKGFSKIDEYLEIKVIRKQLKSNSKVHDTNLIHIGERLKRSKYIDKYHTENELQCIENFSISSETSDAVEIRSDGFGIINKNNKLFNVAIEYEHSDNVKTKYEQLIIDYYLSSQINLVFFFTKHRWVKNHIFKFEKLKYENSIPKFYINDFEDGQNIKDSFTFINRKGQTLKI